MYVGTGSIRYMDSLIVVKKKWYCIHKDCPYKIVEHLYEYAKDWYEQGPDCYIESSSPVKHLLKSPGALAASQT